MRPFTLGILGVAVLGLGSLYLAYFHSRPAHLAALVPEDFAFGVFYSSLNELQELYESPGQRRDSSPARTRVGEPINVPGFDGVAYDEPVGSYWTAEHEEIFLVPLVDRDAFDRAFERNRERITLKAPHPAARNYVSVSEGDGRARRGPDRGLVLRALQFPVSLCGRPRRPDDLRRMLGSLLVREDPRKPQGVPLLSTEVLRMPPAAGAFVAGECRDLLLGVGRPPGPTDALPIRVEASLESGRALDRAAALVERADLAGLMASFPFNTVLCAGAVLDAEGWKGVGLEAVGSGAFAMAVVEHPHHARRFTLLAAARPADPADIRRLDDAVGAGRSPALSVVRDGETEVRTWPLATPPAWLEGVLRSSAREAPPVYVSTAAENGIWYGAVGAQAETVVRHCLGCLRGAPELGLQRVAAVGAHGEFLRGPHAALALVTAAGLKALEAPMPMVELASFGTPGSVTAVLDLVDGRATADLRLAR